MSLLSKANGVNDALHFVELLLSQILLLTGYVLVVSELILVLHHGILVILEIVSIFKSVVPAELIDEVPLVVSHQHALLFFCNDLISFQILALNV